jgi:cytochrome c-type biogenesis protein CcmH
VHRTLSRLSRLAAAALLALTLAAPAARAVDPTDLGDPVLQQRYLGLTHELRCMQCQNESIADSPVALAGDLRRQVAEMLKAGRSDEDVRAYMTARYGDFILFRPRFVARNLWLWAAPVVLLVAGVAVAARILRQRSRLLESDTEPLEDEA